MRIDREVHDRKFSRSIATLRAQEATLRLWGVFVVRVEKPEVDLLLVPRHSARLSLPLPSPADDGSLLLQAFELPSISARPVGIRISLDDYDQRAPSVSFRDPWSWNLIPFEQLMRGQVLGPAGAWMNVILPDHPQTHQPFLCIRGVREYHEHPQHTGDDWALYRSSISLFTLVQRLWQVLIVDIRPNLILLPRQGGLNVTIQWESEAK